MNRLDDGVRPPTAAERLIFRWDSSSSTGFDDSCFRMLFDADNRAEAHRYLRAVDEVRRTSLRRRDSGSGSGSGGAMARSASVALKAAMARLEEEMRHILFTRTNPIEVDSLFADFASLSLSSVSVDFGEGSGGGGGGGAAAGSVSFSSTSASRRRRVGRADSAAAAVVDDDDDAYGAEEEEEEEEERDQPPLGASGSSSSIDRAPVRTMSSIAEIELLPSDAVADIRSIAEQMFAAGHARECAQAYASARRAALETALQQLGTDRFAPGDVHRLPWEVVEAKIRRWIRAARVCVRVVFASERGLCDQVFEGLGLDAEVDDGGIQQLHPRNRRRSTSGGGSGSISSVTPEAAFADMVKGAVNQLFGFVDAVSSGPRSPEKLFKILDLHDALNDLMPDIEFVFRGSNGHGSPSASPDSIPSQAAGILSRLADAIRWILSDFESAVHHEVSRPVPNGSLHPLTRYVINYIGLITDYKQSLDNVIVSVPDPPALLRPPADNPNAHSPPPPSLDFHSLENQSPLAAHLVWIITILDANLETKSRLYRDQALAFIFVMNNLHYIVNKVRSSQEMLDLIGDDFVRRLKGKYLQATTAYQRATWVRVLHCLREEGLHPAGGFSSGTSKTTLRERFRAFNAAFEETHRVQSAWSVPDDQLKQELRIFIADRLIPAYRSFLGRYGSIIENGKHPELYIRYTVEQLEAALDDFFEGRRGH